MFRGQSDVDLDETGLRQAALLAQYLADRQVEAVFSSPLQRAGKTAAAIARRHDLPVQVTDSLNDISFGEWEGMLLSEVQAKYKVLYMQWLLTPHLVRLPGGDSLDNVARRAMLFVSQLVTRYQGAVVLVSHRVVHKVIILALLGLDNSHFLNIKLDTAAITTFTCEQDRFVLTEHNNTSYLKSLEIPGLRDF